MFFASEQVQARARCGSTCRLDRTCLTPRMRPSGRRGSALMALGEAPGKHEDEQGEAFVGDAGKLVRREMRAAGWPLEKCTVANAVRCRPPSNRTPTGPEVDACRERLARTLARNKPCVVLAFGGTALRALLGDRVRWAGGSFPIGTWRGHAIPDPQHGCWIMPTWHPSYLLRSGEEEALMRSFRLDVTRAVALAREQSRPPPLPEPDAVIVPEQHAVMWMEDVLEEPPPLLAVDFETTGLKPHAAGHRVVSCSLAATPTCGIAFLLKHAATRQALVNLLNDKRVPKCAHNIKFEDTWARVRLGAKPKGWAWDSMLAAHVLDNRKGVTGLKYQAATRLAAWDWSSRVSAMLRPTPRNERAAGGNALNQIDKLPEAELLRYNALDAVLELRLALMQRSRRRMVSA